MKNKKLSKMSARHTQGLRILKKVLEESSWDILVDNDISDDDFFGDSKVCLTYMREHEKGYKEIPPLELLIEDAKIKFPADVARDFVIRDFQKYKLTKKLQVIFNGVKDDLIVDPWKCFQESKMQLNKIQFKSLIGSFTSEAEKRFQEYLKDKLTEVQGIVPPYPSMVDGFDLFEKGTINALLGITGTGKTWLSCVMALHAAFAQGKKVLLVSMENPKSSIDSRLEALYFKLPFTHLKKHQLDMRTQNYWLDSIPNLKAEEGDIVTVDRTSVATCADLMQVIATVQPDFVVVDGAYKVSATIQGTSYEKSSRVLQELEDIAKLCDIPLLASSQLNQAAQTASGGRDVGFEARFTKEWLMNPSVVMCLTQTEDDLVFDKVKCTISKVREHGGQILKPFYIRENKITMDFSEEREDYLNAELLNSLY